jgi:DNA excision repair protein ERCC-5
MTGVSRTSKGKGKEKDTSGIDGEPVYLEDLLEGSAPKTPKNKSKEKAAEKGTPGSTENRARWRDHDTYKLPEVDMNAAVTRATRSSAPDPRLATEEELRMFIEQMRPEDLDVTSPEFRELPTEVQYEIIGDLRLKSRQTSHFRLQEMLRSSRTALDFSKLQILGLKQRNALTQQLLETTDSIAKAHVSIPVRIASERNKQYILVKNESAEGGWILGVRDEGTAEKPIEVDRDEEDNRTSEDEQDEETDMEEVSM